MEFTASRLTRAVACPSCSQEPSLHCKGYRVCATQEVGGKQTVLVESIRQAGSAARQSGRETKPTNRILTVSPILSPVQDLSPGMTSSLRQVALKARESSSGRSRTSSSTLERIFWGRRREQWGRQHRLDKALSWEGVTPSTTVMVPHAWSLSQDLAVLFPTWKCLWGWEGASGKDSDLWSLGSLHTWVEADALSWSREDAQGWRNCQICVGCLQCQAVAILGARELLAVVGSLHCILTP